MIYVHSHKRTCRWSDISYCAFVLQILEMSESIYVCILVLTYFSLVAQELVYSLANVEETADQSNLVYSLANDDRTPAQPAASSDLTASDSTVYELASAEEKEYENLEAMKR